MALTTCPDCGRDVSTLATTCPGCGRPMRTVEPRKSRAGGVFWGLFHFFITLPVVLMILFFACVMGVL